MPASQGLIKIFRGYRHWKDYGAPSHTEFKMKQHGTTKHNTYLPACCNKQRFFLGVPMVNI